MCNPALIIGAGLTAAGGISRGLTNKANVDAQRRIEQQAYLRSKAAREAELVRQQAFETQANDSFNNTLSGMDVTDLNAARDAAINDFMATVNGQQSGVVPEGFLLQGQDNATTEVRQEIAARAAKAAAEARDRISALAKLTSYDSAALDRNLALQGGANTLSTINNMRRGSAGVSQAEQTIAAGQLLPADNLLADILTGAGSSLTGAYWNG